MIDEATLFVVLPMRLESPLNGQRGWSKAAAFARVRERRGQRGAARMRVEIEMNNRRLKRADLVPGVVQLTRVSAGRLDDDNLAAAFKSVRDGVAFALSVNDGRDDIRWTYAQKRGPRGVYLVEIRIDRVMPQLPRRERPSHDHE